MPLPAPPPATGRELARYLGTHPIVRVIGIEDGPLIARVGAIGSKWIDLDPGDGEPYRLRLPRAWDLSPDGRISTRQLRDALVIRPNGFIVRVAGNTGEYDDFREFLVQYVDESNPFGE